MQQFVVPQFIEVEDKIFGPITTRQFLILMGAGGLIFLGWTFGDFMTFVITFLVVGGMAVLFAFVKVNGQVFHIFMLNVLISLRKPSIRIWKKDYSNTELDYLRKLGTEEVVVIEDTKKRVKQKHMKNLSLIVNTGGYYNGDDDGF